MSSGACSAYKRGRCHCAQYFHSRGRTPWVALDRPGWGQRLLDFTMFGHSVLRMKPPTTQGKVCEIRHCRASNGWPDFTTSGSRYIQSGKSIRVIHYADASGASVYRRNSHVRKGCFYDIGKGLFRVKEMWESSDLSFFSATMYRNGETSTPRCRNKYAKWKEQDRNLYLSFRDRSITSRAFRTILATDSE